jgi:exodeoxyribonuclease V alpha subunit
MAKFTGSITRIVYRKDEFAIAKFTTIDTNEAASQEITIVGTLLKEFEVGQVEVWGEFEEKEKYGRQLKIEAASMAKPTTLQQTVNRLVNDKKIVGVGKGRAALLKAHFGEDLMEVLDKYPERLVEVKGISKERAKKIAKGWQEGEKDRAMHAFLAEIGIMADGLAKRVRKRLGDNAEQIIRDNPYRLIEVSGIGFKRADAIARSLGISESSPDRARAILTYLLDQWANDGHTYMPAKELLAKAQSECLVSRELVAEQLQLALTEEVSGGSPALRLDTLRTTAGNVEIIYLRRFYNAEKELAKDLRRLSDCQPNRKLDLITINYAIGKAEKVVGLTLNEKQREAIRMTLTNSLSILTGWPGTGKTTVLKVLVEVAKALNFRMALAAPTGRAAKRMREVTNFQAQTLHLLLQAKPDMGGFQKGKDDQLDNDLLIFDEFSMVDIELGAATAAAVQSGTCVLFVGDPNQLPSVGPGRVLDDLITCERITQVKLTEIFRQAAQSLIINNAHAILNGVNPRFFADPKGKEGPLGYDCYHVEPPKLENVKFKPVDVEWVKNMVVKMARDRVPQKLGLDPIRDVQVLIPQKRGACGVWEMNKFMQKALNPRPEKERITIGSREYRIGDRVMVTKNNRELEVSNGDIGFIKKFDDEEKQFLIDFEGVEVVYPFDETDDLVLSYASTIHKSQGSEYKVVIVVLLNEHYMMLKRNLLFTAATRAKQLLLFVSQHSAITRAVQHNEVENRLSLLSMRLRVGLKPAKSKEAA